MLIVLEKLLADKGKRQLLEILPLLRVGALNQTAKLLS